jgi:hypothetical protein
MKKDVTDTLNSLFKNTDSDRKRDKRSRKMSIGWRPGDPSPALRTQPAGAHEAAVILRSGYSIASTTAARRLSPGPDE